MTQITAISSTILVIDDQQSNLTLLTNLLSQQGYIVRVFSSGKLALESLSVELPDLILLDIKMPEIDGYQICQQLKDNPHTQDIPIIFISALDQAFDKVKAFEAGGVDYIVKPFDVVEVVARINNQLKIRSLQVQLKEQNQQLQTAIQKQNKTEEILYQSRSLLSSVLNTSLDGIAALEAVRDGTGEISDFFFIVVNPVIVKILGIAQNNIIGNLRLKRWLKQIDENLFETLVRVVETGETLENDICYTHNTITAWYHYIAVKLGDGLAITVRDITQRQEMSLQLAQQNIQLQKEIAQRKKSEFILRNNFRRNLLLQEIIEDIRSSLDVKHIFETAAQQIGQNFKVNRCIIHTYISDPIPRTLYVAEYLKSGQPAIIDRERLVKSNGYFQTILSDKKIFFTDDVYRHKLLSENEEFFKSRQVKSIMMIKTSYQTKPNGLIYLEQCDRHRSWSEEEVNLLETVAAQLGIAIAQSDLIEQLKEANTKLEFLANLDGLTQVANRRRFDQVLAQEWLRCGREKTPLSLIMCDVDYFKLYNDTYQHQMGDICLKKVAQAIANVVQRPADLVARFGGEEFAIILPNTDENGSRKVAQLIRQKIHNLKISHAASPINNYVTLSLGVATMVPETGRKLEPTQSEQDLIAQADQALFKAKEQGRDRLI